MPGSRSPARPIFLWVHFFDPHDPYDPPPPFKERYAKAPYDGEIAYMDSAIARLMAELKKDGLYDGLAIAVTADHGESLGAHGEDQHGIFVYDETIHVPLLIKLPHEQSAGKNASIVSWSPSTSCPPCSTMRGSRCRRKYKAHPCSN